MEILKSGINLGMLTGISRLCSHLLYLHLSWFENSATKPILINKSLWRLSELLGQKFSLAEIFAESIFIILALSCEIKFRETR